ncbi:hypothetical protein BGX34_004028, partial [Mortierella sp. NVP85]
MDHEIAFSYIRLGRVLAIRGYRKEAQAIYKKAEKLGVKIQDFGGPAAAQSIDTKSIAPSVESSVDPIDDTSSVKSQSIRPQGKSNNINDVATIPAHIFAENVRAPSIVAKLPEPDERLINTPQLAWCLGLLNESHEIDDILEPVARDWLQIAENDEDEQERLKMLAKD